MRKLDNKGNAAILLCLVVTALFGFTAFAVDIGLVYVEKTKLTQAMDAAALAGVLELPNDETLAKTVAAEYLQRNAVSPEGITITTSLDKRSIQIEGIKNIKHLFAPIIGIKSSNIKGLAQAVIGPAKSVTGGIRPFAVQIFDFAYGDLVTLKEDAGDGSTGNYGAIALGGRGSSIFKINALYGYAGTLSVGDYIDTEPGNMAGAANAIKNYINAEVSTYDNFPRDSIRVWTIPLVDTFQVNGRGEIKVVGFAAFYLEQIQGQSGQIEIQGRFVRFVANAEVDLNLTDTGLYGAKLSK